MLTSQERQKAKEKEIAELYANFKEAYHYKVKPQIRKFEKERKLKFYIAIIITLLALSFYAYLWISNQVTIEKLLDDAEAYTNMVLLFIACFIPYTIIAKRFRKRIKKKFFPYLLKAFPEFTYKPDEQVSQEKIKSTQLFEDFNYLKQDDRFIGKYKNIPVDMYELKLEKEKGYGRYRRTITIFSGLVIDLIIPKHYMGTTIISNKDNILPQKEYKHSGLKEANLEDPVFSKKYTIYTNDQVEARYIFTPTFMNRYQKIEEIFKTKYIKTLFNYNKITFAIDSKDLFEIAHLHKSMLNTRAYAQFFKELCVILELVIELRFNEDIGL